MKKILFFVLTLTCTAPLVNTHKITIKNIKHKSGGGSHLRLRHYRKNYKLEKMGRIDPGSQFTYDNMDDTFTLGFVYEVTNWKDERKNIFGEYRPVTRLRSS